jgi:predicted nucleic acid-binding protein
MFIDTSYLFALEFKNDQYHHIAQRYWQKWIPNRLVTTSYVFDELMTFFNKSGYHAKVVTVGNTLLNSSFIELIQIDEALFLEGWAYFQQHDDKTYSLTDCISFVVMQKLKINTALTFDKHFLQAGFLIEPTE